MIENMASSDFEAQHDRAPTTYRGVMELNSQDAIMAQQLIKASSQLHHHVLSCSICGGEHTMQ